MSCEGYLTSQGLDRKSGESIDDWYLRAIGTTGNKVNDLGMGCLLKYPDPCRKQCKDLSKSPNDCFSCLQDGFSCAKNGQRQPGNTAISPIACCEFAEDAIICQRCLAENGGNANALEICRVDKKLSKTTKTGIIAGSVIGAVLLIVAIVLGIKYSKRASAKEALELTLTTNPKNQKLLKEVMNIQNVNSQIYTDIRKRLQTNQPGQQPNQPSNNFNFT